MIKSTIDEFSEWLYVNLADEHRDRLTAGDAKAIYSWLSNLDAVGHIEIKGRYSRNGTSMVGAWPLLVERERVIEADWAAAFARVAKRFDGRFSSRGNQPTGYTGSMA